MLLVVDLLNFDRLNFPCDFYCQSIASQELRSEVKAMHTWEWPHIKDCFSGESAKKSLFFTFVAAEL